MSTRSRVYSIVGVTPTSIIQMEALLQKIEPRWRPTCSAIVNGEGSANATFAQAFQDWWLYHNLYSSNPGAAWGAGVYVEIGVWNPLLLSSTLFFDKCLGWRGVCFEANPKWHKAIRASRSCTLVPHCALGTAGSVRLATPAHGRQDAGTHVVRPGASLAHNEALTVREERCVVASDELIRLGVNRVDLLSVDVEGAEADVLRCFPLDALKVRAVLLELDRVVTQLLLSAGIPPLRLGGRLLPLSQQALRCEQPLDRKVGSQGQRLSVVVGAQGPLRPVVRSHTVGWEVVRVLGGVHMFRTSSVVQISVGQTQQPAVPAAL